MNDRMIQIICKKAKHNTAGNIRNTDVIQHKRLLDRELSGIIGR